MPTPSRDNLSPFSAWSSKPSRIKRLKAFGCKAFILVHKNQRKWKLSPTSEEGILLGFINDNSAYKILQIRDKAVIITRHALFVEDSFPSLAAKPDIHDCSRWVEINQEDNEPFLNCKDIEPKHTDDMSDVHHLNTSPSIEQAPQISENPDTCHPENHCRIKVIGPWHPTLIQGHIDSKKIFPYSRRPKAFVVSGSADTITYSRAVSGDKSSSWLDSIHREMNAMQKLDVWNLITLEKDFKLVGTTWVFRQKRNDLTEVTKYKARLCAQGFSQAFGKDYSKNFAPTINLHSLQTLIAFSVSHKLDFQQLDIHSAFLNAPLDEKVPLAWYKRLTTWLEGLGFNASVSAPFFGNELFFFKEDIKKEFEVKDLGKDDVMLGIKLIHAESGIIISQAHYVESVLAVYGMGKCKPMTTPMVPNSHLEKGTQEECSCFDTLNINYRSAIGSLNCLSEATRPDIYFAVSYLSQFLEKPGISHWTAFLHFLHYLRGTVAYGLHYTTDGVGGLCAYSDADWGNCRQTRRTVSGFVISFKGFLVIWKSRMQPSVSLSKAEAEYKALTDLSKEVLWLRQLVKELSLCDFDSPTIIFEDNQGCINTANSDSNSNTRQMKHVDIKLHFIREAIWNGLIKVIYIPSDKMLADFMTKSVCRPALVRCLNALNVLSLRERGDVES
ncbi:hypothetical protein O181_012027 [Austropuccinia psidii MF-1]|uniref:Reverse transcriptase Ty1/copia-type domain-containing protein n=1 Tax=Austropuccinia psidii MF-1 TaxID=1389203 RepID=A0A9Q3BVP0_9BASI|nr:hypothetical protein [Austropuccinia psidii MF-1]